MFAGVAESEQTGRPRSRAGRPGAFLVSWDETTSVLFGWQGACVPPAEDSIANLGKSIIGGIANYPRKNSQQCCRTPYAAQVECYTQGTLGPE